MVHGCRLRYYGAVPVLTLETRASIEAKFLGLGRHLPGPVVVRSFHKCLARIVGLAQSPSRDFHATNSEVGSITAVASSSPSLLHERSREEAGVGAGAATAAWTTRGVAAPRHIRNASSSWERVWLGIVLKPRG
jgi:hypothetical protein